MSNSKLIDVSKYMTRAEYTQSKALFISKFDQSARHIAEVVFETITPNDFKTNIKQLAATVDYAGYDPVIILREFIKRAEAAKDKTGEVEIFDSAGNKILTIPNKGDVIIDLSILVYIFVTRGTVAHKILKRIEEQWIGILKVKFDIYGINYTKSKPSQLGPKDITLARLAGAVPQFVIALMHKGFGKIYINRSLLSRACAFHYPKATLTHMFAGMVPRTGTGSDLIEHCYMYAFMFDRIINLKKKINDFSTYLLELKKYVDATNKSELFSDNYRRDVLCKIGLMEFTREFTNGTYRLTQMGDNVRKAGSGLWGIISKNGDVYSATNTLTSHLEEQMKINEQLDLGTESVGDFDADEPTSTRSGAVKPFKKYFTQYDLAEIKKNLRVTHESDVDKHLDTFFREFKYRIDLWTSDKKIIHLILIVEYVDNKYMIMTKSIQPLIAIIEDNCPDLKKQALVQDAIPKWELGKKSFE